MHNSERYPYLTCIDSQALLAQCEKKEIKDGLSVLTQYLHNRKYLSQAGLNEALSFMAEEVLDKEGSGKLALKDDHLELLIKPAFMFRKKRNLYCLMFQGNVVQTKIDLSRFVGRMI